MVAAGRWSTPVDLLGRRAQPVGGLPNHLDEKVLWNQIPYTPSIQECRFCDITEPDCPERLEGPYEPAETAIEDFQERRRRGFAGYRPPKTL